MAILAATESDLEQLTKLAQLPLVEHRKLYMSKLFVHAREGIRYAIVGPFIGAPYAAMIVESLWVWGVKQILFIGWCGAVSRKVKAGDIIVPTGAMVEEGTSGLYCDPSCRVALPTRKMTDQTKKALLRHDAAYHEGPIWTTDAIFRETVEKVKHYQSKGALAVEMELSAVFTVADFRQMAAAGILVVSDEVSDYQWRPGFNRPDFAEAREKTCRAAITIAASLGKE